MVVIQFNEGASQQERQSTVDRIHGVVVGGSRLAPFSFYYVRIPGTTYDDIMDACNAIGRRPSVFSAFPMSTDGSTIRPSRTPTGEP
jgi:hypothetical protein